MEHKRLLAQSENYKISHEYETVFLTHNNSNTPDIVIGDFYADPEAAIIDAAERFVIMVGYGLIVYYLAMPFEAYLYDLPTSQWRELFREKGNELWIEKISQQSKDVFHFTVDSHSNEGGTYELVFPDLTSRKLS